jgi:hypothetical protein
VPQNHGRGLLAGALVKKDPGGAADVVLHPVLPGRVKTLHPGVHGGILARRDLQEHLDAEVVKPGHRDNPKPALWLQSLYDTLPAAVMHAQRLFWRGAESSLGGQSSLSTILKCAGGHAGCGEPVPLPADGDSRAGALL